MRNTAARIREVQDFLEIPIAVENVSSYAEFHESQMTEWEFLNEIVHAADCGILLDVNNIYVSSQNHGFDPAEYVNSIAAERVAQVHIAGILSSKSTRSIHMTIRYSTRFGSCTRRPSNGRVPRRPSWNGTIEFRRSMRYIQKRSKRTAISPPR